MDTTDKKLAKSRWRIRKEKLRRCKWALKNFLDSLVNVMAVSRDYMSSQRLISRLRILKKSVELTEGNGSKCIHFVFGMKRSEEITYYQYISIKSAHHFNREFKIIFHYVYEPFGVYWDSIKSFVSVNQIDQFEYYGIARFCHYAHKADIIRLLALREIGGVYLDIDTLTLRSFEDLLLPAFVMGIQGDAHDEKGGLCNAVMAGQANSVFSRMWVRKYVSFRSRGRDSRWDYHSVKLPMLLYAEHTDLVTVRRHDFFFWPLWRDINRFLLAEGSNKYRSIIDNSCVIHLWNGYNEKLLSSINQEYISTSSSLYANLVREMGVKFD